MTVVEPDFQGIKRLIIDALVRSGVAGTAGDMTHPCQAHEVAEVVAREVHRIVAVYQDHAVKCLDEREEQTGKWIEAAAERDAAESSRRDWAAEAIRLEAEWENLAKQLVQQGDQCDRHGRAEGCEEDGCDDLGECHTTAAVATWYDAAALVKRRLAEQRDLSRPEEVDQ